MVFLQLRGLHSFPAWGSGFARGLGRVGGRAFRVGGAGVHSTEPSVRA